MQDNNFPALTEHRRDSGPLQAWPATVAFEKGSFAGVLNWQFSSVHVLSRFTLESVLVSKSPPWVTLAVALLAVHVVSPPGTFVTARFCQSQGGTREAQRLGPRLIPATLCCPRIGIIVIEGRFLA